MLECYPLLEKARMITRPSPYKLHESVEADWARHFAIHFLVDFERAAAERACLFRSVTMITTRLHLTISPSPVVTMSEPASFVPTMYPSLTKPMRNVINLQARVYIRETKLVLSDRSIDWMSKTSDAFVSFLESSENKIMANMLWAMEEKHRIEYIIKLLRVQIRYLKKRKEYGMTSWQ